MRAYLGFTCIAMCGVAAGVMLWRDRGPAGQSLRPTHAQAHPRERDRPEPAAHPGPRPTLAHLVADRRPAQPMPDAPAPGAPAPGSDDDSAVTRALIRASLARDLPRKLPELELSAADLERLSDAMLHVREQRVRLRDLAHTRDNASEIRRLEQGLVQDLLAFEEITGMSAIELTGALSDEGITTEEQDHAAKPVYTTLPE